MTEEPKPAQLEQSPDATGKAVEPEVVIRGSDLIAILFGVPVFLIVAGSGVLNILAAKGGWNPFHWQGRLYTGIFMIAAPSVLGMLAALPFRIRSKMPDAVAEIAVLLVWIAFFWAACGGH